MLKGLRSLRRLRAEEKETLDALIVESVCNDCIPKIKDGICVSYGSKQFINHKKRINLKRIKKHEVVPVAKKKTRKKPKKCTCHGRKCTYR
ncbi:MAG: hypothetical protein QW666_04545 [Candidatus Woesearchaeota archaeon]